VLRGEKKGGEGPKRRKRTVHRGKPSNKGERTLEGPPKMSKKNWNTVAKSEKKGRMGGAPTWRDQYEWPNREGDDGQIMGARRQRDLGANEQ